MGAVIFRNAAVLDVLAGALSLRDVLVIDERIAEISEQRLTFTEARIIEVAGRVLMPGLCDAHVHVTAVTADFAAIERLAPSYVAAHAARILNSMLLRGFTTVRDAGGADQGLARALAERLIVGPRLLQCGKALSQTGGHGDMRLAGEQRPAAAPSCCGLGRICDGVAEVRRACRDVIRTGASHIKLMASGGVSSPTDRISSTQFSREELAAAVEEASAAEIYCMAHAYTPRAIQQAVSVGVRSIEHGNLLDEQSADLMREHGAFLVPTLVTYHALAREGVAAGLPAELQVKLSEVLRSGLGALELAVRAGVQVAFGTDLLGTMHQHQLDEFMIRREVQQPIDIIRGATVNAARLFKMEGEIGVVAPGAIADLLVVDGNPLDDLSILHAPHRALRVIMRQGDLVRCDE
ncbi:MAG TPA: amidohydrolase family protein [Steroidobacteraceae bacterium]|nr:amidohydrolase family protein [Steroidobacteraceae bacterium]